MKNDSNRGGLSRLIAMVATGVLMALAASQALADDLEEAFRQDPNHSNAWLSYINLSGPEQRADRFSPTSSQTSVLRRVTWYGGYSAVPATDNFTILIFEGNSNGTTTLVHRQDLGNDVNRTDTGNLIGGVFTEFSYDVEVTGDVVLDPNRTYYISIVNNLDSGIYWGWEWSDDGDGVTFVTDVSSGDPDDIGFTSSGEEQTDQTDLAYILFVIGLASYIDGGFHFARNVPLAPFYMARVGAQDVNGRLFALRAARGSAETAGGERRKVQFWIEGNFGYTDVDDNSERQGFESDFYSSTVGADFSITPDWTIGLGIGMDRGNMDMSGSAGDVDLDGWHLGIYSSLTLNDFYFDLSYTYGDFGMDLTRNAGAFGTATADDVRANTHDVTGSFGYNFYVDRLVHGPFAILEYTWVTVDGYSESGASIATVNANKQNLDTLSTSLGWQASYLIPLEAGMLVPQLRASWGYEGYGGDETTVSSVVAPSSVISGETAVLDDESFLNLGGGMQLQLNSGWSLGLDLSTQLLREDTTTISGGINVSYTW